MHCPDDNSQEDELRRVHVSLVIPTYNEKDNIRPLFAAVSKAMQGQSWELIFVDDDSPDLTYREVLALALVGAPVRCIRRIGRRGLASAVVEGAMSANGELIGVMDADLQHDEKLLPRMIDILRNTDADIVIGTRYAQGGSVGEWNKSRQAMSGLAAWLSRMLVGDRLSDSMSGFFMTRRLVIESSIYDLSQQGYKILLDILTSAPRPLKIREIPYKFRNRLLGQSKLDTVVLMEYAFLLIDKLSGGMAPPRFFIFSLVGGVGLAVHLSALNLLKSTGVTFLPAQILATITAMTSNYIINNAITYRSDRLQGKQFLIGYFVFCAVCSLGAIANVGVANLAISQVDNWSVAGVAGAIMSSVFNYGVSTKLVWGARRRRPALSPAGLAVSRRDVHAPKFGSF